MNGVRKKFGTAPVFFTAISTILGAIMFLRFGFAVGTVGFIGTLLIVLIGHAVTIPTAMSIAEIATNQKVEGGGEYYIISRSFGLVVGSSIGIALYFSQAISVAFYIIAFAESFSSLFEFLMNRYDLPESVIWLLQQKQTVSIPALFLLMTIVLTKGADLGVKTLYVVVLTLFLSLIAFFVGKTEYNQTTTLDPFANVYNSQEQDLRDTAHLSIATDTNRVEVGVMRVVGHSNGHQVSCDGVVVLPVIHFVCAIFVFFHQDSIAGHAILGRCPYVYINPIYFVIQVLLAGPPVPGAIGLGEGPDDGLPTVGRFDKRTETRIGRCAFVINRYGIQLPQRKGLGEGDHHSVVNQQDIRQRVAVIFN